MSVPNRTGVPEKTSQTEQYVLNYSFDELYKILMVGLTAYNAGTASYDRVQIGSDGGLKMSSFVPGGYDYVACTYPDSVTDVFTFKSGGSGGDIISTVTISYTDSTKAVMTSVART